MIEVVFEQEDGLLVAFSSKGHAQAGDPGEDIVCAAVSALLFSVVNTLEHYHAMLDVKMGAKGFLRCELKEGYRDKEIQAILQVAKIGISGIVQEYSEFISMDIIDRRIMSC
ncbi:MAG TPA: ribosomal-processing cysteine protease Prp [Clostridia bacterium]|nr:ribosomal-processing cysteine protease Prp [Clostridia bacterium]